MATGYSDGEVTQVLGQLKFLAPNSPSPSFGPSTGGAAAQSTLVGEYEDRTVEISNGREAADTFDLDTHGFALARLSPVGDLYDSHIVGARHDVQCRALVTVATGAERVEVFDHTWRSSAADIRERHASREASAFIHNDYTPRSALKRLRELMGNEAEELSRRDFAIVNVWRPITTVQSSPLALCDARTVSSESLVPAVRRGKGRVGEIYLIRYDPAQRWLYFPGMPPEEVLLIKTFDSRTDGRARWCMHTSFGAARDDAALPARESMETRLFAFFD